MNQNNNSSSISSPTQLDTTKPDLGLMNDHIKNILVTVSKNPVTNVIAGSGTGKTIKLPLGIAGAGNKISVIVSNDSIASSLVGYVRSVSGSVNIGSSNPTNSELPISISTDITGSDSIKYIGESSMKEYIYKVIQGGSDLDFSDIIMIDEADAGTLDQFLIMALWRYCATHGAKVPRLLLVSTTPIVSDQFDIEPYVIDSIDGSGYGYGYGSLPEIRYGKRDYMIGNPNHSTELFDDVAELVYDLHTSSIKGDFLIFTTGKLQIESLIQKLESLQMENINIYPAHKDLTGGEIDRLYQETSDRKIIVADELAETTFSMNSLGVIIDLMINHRRELSLTGGQRYPKKYITKDIANIRSRRGGKYGTVLSYRMITQKLYNKLSEKMSPEIYRVPLHWIMLELIENGIYPFDLLDMFDKDILNHTYKLITRFRFINTNGKITNVGKFVTKIPYGIRQAAALYQWLENDYQPYPAITILSMIDAVGKSYYVYPLRNSNTSHSEYTLELLDHRKEYFEPFAGASDVHTYGHIWETMMNEVGLDVSSSDIQSWCVNNYIRYENISEVLYLNRVVSEEISKNRSEPIEIGPFDSNNLLDLIGPILVNIYGDRRLVLEDTNSVVRVRYLGDDNKYYKINDRNGINTIEMDIPKIIFGLITSTIKSKYTSDFNTVICSLVR